MRLIPPTTQGKVTLSLSVALALVVAVSFSGVGGYLHDSGIMMRLFLLFLGAAVVGFVFALQVIPGLLSLDTMVRAMRRIMRNRGGADRDGSP